MEVLLNLFVLFCVNFINGLNSEVIQYDNIVMISQPNILINGNLCKKMIELRYLFRFLTIFLFPVNCSTLMCPKKAFKCVVMSKALKQNREKILTLAICKDKNNVVLKRKKYKEKNPYPDAQPPYKKTTSATRDGVILTKGEKSKELTEKFEIIDKNIQTKFDKVFNEPVKGKTKNVNKQHQQGTENAFKNKFDNILSTTDKAKIKNVNKQHQTGRDKDIKSKFDDIFDSDFPFQNGNPFDSWPFDESE